MPLKCVLMLVMALFMGHKGQSQHRVEGTLYHIIDSTPLRNAIVWVDRQERIVTNDSGRFVITSAKRTLRITHGQDPCVKSVDTTIFVKFITAPMQLYAVQQIDSAQAAFDWLHGRGTLFCIRLSQEETAVKDMLFENTYKVKLCYNNLPLGAKNQYKQYNAVMAKYLDERYGANWRQQLPAKLLGL